MPLSLLALTNAALADVSDHDPVHSGITRPVTATIVAMTTGAEIGQTRGAEINGMTGGTV